MAEKGYKKSSIATGSWPWGSKGLAPAIVSKWEEAIDKTMKDPKVIAIVEKLEGVVIDFKGGEDYKKELMANFPVFKEIVSTLPGKK